MIEILVTVPAVISILPSVKSHDKLHTELLDPEQYSSIPNDNEAENEHLENPCRTEHSSICPIVNNPFELEEQWCKLDRISITPTAK